MKDALLHIQFIFVHQSVCVKCGCHIYSYRDLFITNIRLALPGSLIACVWKQITEQKFYRGNFIGDKMVSPHNHHQLLSKPIIFFGINVDCISLMKSWINKQTDTHLSLGISNVSSLRLWYFKLSLMKGQTCTIGKSLTAWPRSVVDTLVTQIWKYQSHVNKTRWYIGDLSLFLLVYARRTLYSRPS